MDTESQRPKRREGLISALNAAIDVMNIAKDVMDIAPAKAVFASVSVILTMIKVRFRPFRIPRLLAHVHRTRWSTRLTMSTSGWPAPTSVGPSIVGWAGGKWMRSVNRFSRRYNSWPRELNRRWGHRTIHLPTSQSQGCGQYPEEYHQAGQTNFNLSTPPREER